MIPAALSKSVQQTKPMKLNDQLVIDIEPANNGESCREWSKGLRAAVCEFLDEYVAETAPPIDVTIDVSPLIYNPMEHP